MKKSIPLILVLVFLFMTFCYAESVDIKSLTDDEFVSLSDLIKDECYERGIARSGELAEGAYVIGTDIAAGAYYVNTTEEKYSMYYVFENETDYIDYVSLSEKVYVTLDKALIRSDETGRITFSEGQVLLVGRGGLKLEEIINTLMP